MDFFTSSKRIKKISTRCIIIISLFVILFAGTPKKADAFLGIGDISFDPIQDAFGWISSVADSFTAVGTTIQAGFTGAGFAKEFIGDGIANIIAKQIIRGLTAQTVNWINNGFKGNPAFVTDPTQFFLNIGDSVASAFVAGSPALSQLCTPFKAQVRLQLVKNYLSDRNFNFSCTLGTLEQNYNAFTKDFNQGGWDSWFAVTQVNQNNPYGVYLTAKDSLTIQIANKTYLKNRELDRGNGFLSFKKCVARETPPPVTPTCSVSDAANGLCASQQEDDSATCSPADAANGQCIYQQPVDTPDESGADNSETAPDAPGAAKCIKTQTVTPGSVINNQLSKALGSTWDSLGAADEINEIIGALMTQMVQHVVGGIGNGLRGLATDKGPTNNSLSLLQQMISTTTPEAIKDDTAATDGINNGIPKSLTPGSTDLIPNIPSDNDAENKIDTKLGGHLTPGALGCTAGGVGCSNPNGN